MNLIYLRKRKNNLKYMEAKILIKKKEETMIIEIMIEVRRKIIIVIETKMIIGKAVEIRMIEMREKDNQDKIRIEDPKKIVIHGIQKANTSHKTKILIEKETREKEEIEMKKVEEEEQEGKMMEREDLEKVNIVKISKEIQRKKQKRIVFILQSLQILKQMLMNTLMKRIINNRLIVVEVLEVEEVIKIVKEVVEEDKTKVAEEEIKEEEVAKEEVVVVEVEEIQQEILIIKEMQQLKRLA